MSIAEARDFEVVGEERATPFARQFEATHPDYPGRILVEILGEAHKVGPGADLVAFEHEVVTLSLLGHPNVLEAVDMAALPDGTPVVISSLPAGVSLAQWLHERRRLSAGTALEIVTGIAEAVAVAHERGLSHGCVCAENVFLAMDANGGPITPRVHGFRQRRLCLPKAPGENTRVNDIRELAALGEQLLTPADLRATGVSRSFGVSAAVSGVVERALGEPGFRSARDLVSALAAAVNAEDHRPMRVTDSALVRVETALLAPPRRTAPRGRRRRAPLAVGLLAGCAASLLALLALMAPLSRSGLVSSTDPAETRPDQEAPLVAAPVPLGGGAPVGSPPATLPAVEVAPVPPVVAPVVAVAAPAPLPPHPAAAPAAAPMASRGLAVVGVAPVVDPGVPAQAAKKPSASSARRGLVWSDKAHALVPAGSGGARPSPVGDEPATPGVPMAPATVAAPPPGLAPGEPMPGPALGAPPAGATPAPVAGGSPTPPAAAAPSAAPAAPPAAAAAPAPAPPAATPPPDPAPAPAQPPAAAEPAPPAAPPPPPPPPVVPPRPPVEGGANSITPPPLYSP